MRRRGVLSLLVATALSGASACDRASTEGQSEAAPAATITVQVAPVQGIDEPVAIEATGGFEAAESSDVAPEASGRVSATLVDVGDFVKAGAILVRIQGVDAGLRLDEAKAAASRAESNLKLAETQNTLAQTTAARYAALVATGDVSKTVADQARTTAETALESVNTARASLAEARAQLALAEKAVADVVVAAPFAGYIAERKVSTGEYVQPSTAVVTLVSIDPLRLRLTVPGVQAGQVSVGQTVTASVDAYPGRTFTGRVTALNPSLSAESRSLGLEARVPNRDAALKPGMFAVAQIDTGRRERMHVVPRKALIEDANTNSYRVYVIDHESRARLRVVRLAARQPQDTVRITSGVQEGERVATSNLADLYDGMTVSVAGVDARAERND
ncbi:MAG TPA: efflux RND transporter periplasmic adaptor subunit [Vicinamibacterales bacterium]|nr:efflux RND transporter periplasmic adaptor subunit [Vicinamibacterales bacterium]